MNAPKRRKPRRHFPALSDNEVELVSQRLEANPQISQAARDALLRTIMAARNPNAESPAVVIAALEDAQEKQSIYAAQAEYAQTMNGVMARGRNALAMMSDEEFEALVNEANDD